MSYGLETIRTKGGSAILDQNTRPLRVLSSGTVTRTTGTLPDWAFYVSTGNPYTPWHSEVVRRYDIPIPTGLAYEPIVLIEWPVGSSFFSVGVLNNKLVIANPEQNAPVSLQYYVCDFSIPTSLPSGYGMAIWDANGDLTYSSSESYIRIKEIVDKAPGGYDSANNGGFPKTVTHVSQPNNGLFSVPFLDWHSDVDFGYYLGHVKRASSTQLQQVISAYGTDANIRFRWGSPPVLLGSI